MAFHCTDRHTQHFRDIHWIEIFLIPQQHHHTGAFRQVPDQTPQPFAQKRIPIRRLGHSLGNGIETDTRTEPALSRLIDAAMADSAPKPPRGMRRAFNLTELPVELQKNILRQFLGPFPIAQETHRDAEYQRLVVGDDLRKIHCHIRYYG